MTAPARTQDKRDRLVNAAAELFWTKGYAATSLADIAAAAAVPLGNVYYYFRTKAAFARAVSDLFLADMSEELAAIDRDTADNSERLAALLQLLARGNALRVRHGCPIAGAIRDFSRVDATAAGTAAETFKVLEDWLHERLTATGRSDREARALSRDVVANWQGAAVVAHGVGDEDRLADALRRIAERIGCAAQ